MISAATRSRIRCDLLGPDLGQVRRQQPAADAPRHPEVAVELGRAAVEPAVDVDLLVGRRSVAAVLRGRRARPPPPCTTGSGRRARRRRSRRRRCVAPVAVSAAVRSAMNDSADELQTCSAPAERSSSSWSARAHDVDEGDAVGDAQPVEHLAEVRRRGGVDERGVALAPHRADVPEHGQRVHEARRPFDRRDAGRAARGTAPRRTQRYCEYIAPPSRPTVLPSSACARRRRPGGDDRAAALVADRERLADAPGERCAARPARSGRSPSTPRPSRRTRRPPCRRRRTATRDPTG